MPRHVWSIRVRLEMAVNARDHALSNVAVASKCGVAIPSLSRSAMSWRKIGEPVRFEITETLGVSLDLEPSTHGTHSMRRDKIAQICALFKFCWVIQRLTELYVTSVSTLRTPCHFQT